MYAKAAGRGILSGGDGPGEGGAPGGFPGKRKEKDC